MMFVPMEPPTIDLPMEDLLYGINITFPNGTLVSVKRMCQVCYGVDETL